MTRTTFVALTIWLICSTGCLAPKVLASRELPGEVAEDVDVQVYCHVKADPGKLYKCQLTLKPGDIVWPWEAIEAARKRAADKAQADKGTM